ncbi:MAG: tRNA (N6-threonylcarbamoyladenosine(37)-N6)-methyltransferase TrmO [Ruminococcaceae bacterium]|nr:tRNA (N6-threonylcarbamoyladenosine(37)-N6)-methyltransferase TrmO [Oscillospiraceae bacterium]
MKTELNIIAHIHTDFTSKFGIPRQSGLVDELEATIVFEPEYRNPDALRGIEEYSHIWLLWQFSECMDKEWSPTVRPPRLGGNKRMGVFATRSPFRPNPIGLSSVKLLGVEKTENHGYILRVSGADLLDGTPIYDIKPYLPYVDSHPEASNGFALDEKEGRLYVDFPDNLLEIIPTEKQAALKAVLAQDPRPQYQDNPERIYGIEFAGFDVRFTVEKETLKVVEIINMK